MGELSSQDRFAELLKNLPDGVKIVTGKEKHTRSTEEILQHSFEAVEKEDPNYIVRLQNLRKFYSIALGFIKDVDRQLYDDLKEALEEAQLPLVTVKYDTDHFQDESIYRVEIAEDRNFRSVLQADIYAAYMDRFDQERHANLYFKLDDWLGDVIAALEKAGIYPRKYASIDPAQRGAKAFPGVP